MRKVISLALVTILLLTIAVPAFAAPTPKPGSPAWKAEYTKRAQIPAAPTVSARTNASGDKITSNAHSGDYDGLYFYWDDKQKDNGVLLVREDVFSWFNDDAFTITAKNSSDYWDWKIVKDPRFIIDNVDGMDIYAYTILKSFQTVVVDNKGKEKAEKVDLKNINMIFIDGLWRTADLTIVKQWLDEEGTPLSSLSAFLNGLLGPVRAANPVATFNSRALTPGTYTVRLYASDSKTFTITEDDLTWSDVLQTRLGTITYLFELFSINGDEDATSATVTLTAGSQVTVVFANKLRGIERIAEQELTIAKEWLDCDGEPLTDEALIGLLEDEYLAFTDGYGLGTSTVLAGTRIAFSEEDLTWDDEDGTYYYYFVLDAVTVNGEVVDAVDFEVEKDTDYAIVFTNKMVKEKLPVDEFKPGKISSTQHADRWWESNGIICYSSNTTSNGEYFIAFAPGFWDRNATVVIGFGTANSIRHEVTLTRDAVVGVVVTERVVKDFNLDCHYSNSGTKNVLFSGMDVISFGNPFGSGARQAYLLSVQ